METFVDAARACAFLDIKRASLYAYAARGLVRTAPGKDARSRTYHQDDLRRLKARHDARAGHGAVAANALQWGQPVLDSALCRISPTLGPLYRGRAAVTLAQQSHTFETVAQWLWTGEDAPLVPWRAAHLGGDVKHLSAVVSRNASPQRLLAVLVNTLGAGEAARFGTSAPAEMDRARVLVRRLTAGMALHAPKRLVLALEAPGLAHALLVALGGEPSTHAVAAVNQALIISADHELNASAFAARVAASAGAGLHACLSAALAVHSGPRHGGACDQLEALLADAGRAPRARSTVEAWLASGQQLHGFGHPLYPQGDPRAVQLIELAHRLARGTSRLRLLDAVVDAMAQATGLWPSLDVGLTAVCRALELPVGAPTTLFALGRMAGWVAHTLEQRHSPVLLRPRARYVGP